MLDFLGSPGLPRQRNAVPILGGGLRLLCLISMFAPAWSSAQEETALTDRYAAHEFVAESGKRLVYRWYLPNDLADETKIPLVILLHGAGERGEDNQKQLVHGARDLVGSLLQSRQPCAVLVPQCPADEQWVDTPWSAPEHSLPELPSESLRAVWELTDRLVADEPIDVNRVYLLGLSMGGFGVWDWASREPQRFAAVVPICGGGDSSPEVAKRLSDLPIWAFHGEADNVVTVQRTRAMIQAIRDAGGEPRYTEYPGGSHDSWSATFANPDLYAWLLSHRRGND